jgi:hypothetical protein
MGNRFRETAHRSYELELENGDYLVFNRATHGLAAGEASLGINRADKRFQGKHTYEAGDGITLSVEDLAYLDEEGQLRRARINYRRGMSSQRLPFSEEEFAGLAKILIANKEIVQASDNGILHSYVTKHIEPIYAALEDLAETA